MTLDWSVNIGHVLAALGFVLGASGVVWALRGDMKVLASRLSSVEATVIKLADILIQIGRQEERLNSHDRRITKLEDAD